MDKTNLDSIYFELEEVINEGGDNLFLNLDTKVRSYVTCQVCDEVSALYDKGRKLDLILNGKGYTFMYPSTDNKSNIITRKLPWE